jgi:hypothetical protein
MSDREKGGSMSKIERLKGLTGEATMTGHGMVSADDPVDESTTFFISGEAPTLEQLRESKALGPILRHCEDVEPEKYDKALPMLIKLWHLGVS